MLRNLLDMEFLDFDRNWRTVERVGTDIGRILEELSKPEIARRNPPAQPVAQHQPQLLQPQPYVGYGQGGAPQEARHDFNGEQAN